MERSNEYDINRSLRRLRKSKNLTQKQLANFIGVSDKTVSAWETGNRNILVRDMCTILNKFNLEIRDVFRLQEENSTHYFYVCVKCGNIMSSDYEAKVSCCGLDVYARSIYDVPYSDVLDIFNDGEFINITINHETTKKHHIRFISYYSNGNIATVKIDLNSNKFLRMLYMGKGKIFYYCTKHGLAMQDIN